MSATTDDANVKTARQYADRMVQRGSDKSWADLYPKRYRARAMLTATAEPLTRSHRATA